jgi:hypothetical protein
MKQRRLTEVVGAVSLLAMLSAPALADTHKAHLEGFQEVPALSTTGEGECRVKIKDETTIEVELSYSDLSADVTQAHIHFGQEAVNGGIVLFLCSNLASPPPGTPPCPASPGEVTRTLTSADVIDGAAAQGIAAGELAEVIDAIRADTAYCNVHSTTFPAGEIRGQLIK